MSDTDIEMGGADPDGGVDAPASGPSDAGPSGAGAARRRAIARLTFVAALVVVGVALAIGSGVLSSAPPTPAQRAAAIDAVVRCPSCDDLSVAQSEASSADAVRSQVARLVAAGESATQIENTLVAQYGSSILLSPPDSGLSSIIWLVPAIGGPAAVLALFALFWRRGNELRRLRREAR